MAGVVATNETILVVGGGISGMTAALEAAETGKDVVLVEKNPALGGRVSQLYRYFPKLCHPTCGLEINLRRLKANKRIRVLTLAEVANIGGQAGDYSVQIKVKPRYVNENCTACGECAKAVSSEIPNPFNYNLNKMKAVYLPFNMAHPQRYVIDPSIIGTPEADKAKAACKYDAIDLGMKEEIIDLKVGAIVWATGWRPYDAAKIQPYGYDRYANVVTSVEFERMLDLFGPTGGRILRPSDGKEAKNVAFIQCAGSRDRNHLKHCSRICCMASLKQTNYVTEQFGDAGKSTIYYIDIRAIDRFEDFYQKVLANPNVTFVKSKVANITEDAAGNPVLHGVDTEGYHRYDNAHDLCVLAIGMEPSVDANSIPGGIHADKSGFIEADPANGALFGAGCASNALDVNRSVQSATAASLRAIQVINRVSRAEA
ncbi:MAG TPA: FAD-dependent oxidoreductase [Acidiferrobacterales bacterium]|jgi:quinone-modifying oxidoreductase subunit QmoA